METEDVSYGKNTPSCELYIIGHSTMLYLLVVKRFIVINDVQLRTTLVIILLLILL